jgi:hypothetical protein
LKPETEIHIYIQVDVGHNRLNYKE